MKNLLTGFMLLIANSATAQTCNCGPDFCLNDPRYPSVLEDKRATLRNSYPERLVALLDRGGKCVARLERAPDGFSIMEHRSDASILVSTWTKDAEDEARKGVQDGRLRAFYLFNGRNAFSCCEEAEYSDRPDYDATLDLSRSLAIKCDESNISSRDCGG